MLLGKITRISLQLTLAAVMICAAGCSGRKDGGVFRTEALDASSWDASVWISAADAAVVDGPITGDARAADGASWFVSTVRNEKDVTSAKWMTTGLGVYEIYVNGRLAGDEILKPGFTHTSKPSTIRRPGRSEARGDTKVTTGYGNSRFRKAAPPRSRFRDRLTPANTARAAMR